MKKILIILLLFQPLLSNAQQVKKQIRKGNREYKEEKYSESEKYYRKALELDPKSDKATYNLGNSLYKQDQFEPAITKYESLIKNEDDAKNLAKYYYNLGNSYFKAQKLEKSIEAYKQCLRINTNDADARHNLFLAQSILKQQQQQQNNQQSKPNEPSEFAKKLKAQADKLIEEGKFAEAYKLMTDGLKKDPTVGYYQDFIDKTGKVAAIDLKF